MPHFVFYADNTEDIEKQGVIKPELI